jgi:hypothetical protein
MDNKPIFQHDCNNCRFQGTGKHKGRIVDVYLCTTEYGRTLVLRYSDEGPDYSSGMLFECTGLTEIDKIALLAEVTLTPEEKERLYQILVRQAKSQVFQSKDDYARRDIEVTLGEGNDFFGPYTGPSRPFNPSSV